MTDPTPDHTQPSNPVPPTPMAPTGYPGSPYSPYTAAIQPVYVVSPPKGFSITALVLGLASIFFGFTFLVPIGALIFGIIGAKKEPSGRAMAITGIVIGSLFLLGWLVFGGAILALILGGLAVSTTVPSTY